MWKFHTALDRHTLSAMVTNADIARAFERIALVLNLKGDENPFRIRAYERAALAIANLPTEIATLYAGGGIDALLELPGIGKDLASKMEEMVRTGRLAYLAEVEKGVPEGLLQLLEIEGLGPKRTKFLWDTFKVKSIDDLTKLLASGKLEEIKGWGEKSVKAIQRGIEQRAAMSGRLPIFEAWPLAEAIVAQLRASGLCSRVELAGSLRRRRETIGDIDILVTSDKPEKVMDVFCTLPQVKGVTARGPTKSTVFLKAGLDADLRVVPDEAFGAALLYFTGSKDHNVRLRKMGIARKLTLNEYGLFRGTPQNKGPLVAASTEEEVYKAVGLPYIEPELREDRGEIDAAIDEELPVLVTEKDLHADLHMHSTFSDGSDTMEAMAAAAKARGFQWIAITDHASAMGMVGGIKNTGSSLKDYLAKIAAARKKVKGITILAGAEVDIQKDGSLYLDDDALKQLDWVIGSVHQYFHESREDTTDRLCAALKHPLLHVIGHPTARLLGEREGITFDVETVLQTAKAESKAMELNASPERLDLNDVHCKRAKELGIPISIGSDAHAVSGLAYQYGIAQARRGWLEPGDVLNCWTWEKFEKWVRR